MASRFLKSFLLGATALATASVAQAEPFETWDHGWDGFYAGIFGGGAFGDSRQDNTAGPTTGDYDIDGGFVGIFTGHNWQRGRVVYGIERDFAFGDISGQTTNNCVDLCFTDVNWVSTIRGRIGYDMGRFMPYLTAGVGFGEVDVGTKLAGADPPLSNDDINVGLAVGAGIEAKVTRRINARVEYMWVDLGDTYYHIPAQGQAGIVDADIHMVRAALSYQFGDLGAAGGSASEPGMTLDGWQGAYAGVIGGGVWGTSRQDNSFPATTGDYDIDGGMIGVVGGINWQRSRFIYGFEADISFADVSGQTNNGCGALQCFTDVNWIATARSRIGYDMGRVMPYLTAGVAFGEVEVGTRVPITVPLNDSDVKSGAVFGAGADIKLTDRIVLKGEYLYTNLGDTIYFIPDQGQIGTVPVEDLHMLRAALLGRF
ncbi:outer membrane protein [Tepidamorphus sp. 3E244]|uniref:outer membrane protein n=1 Tax=Tepidamorphus sp. 3E244 TaxID=3385498 RepID=UPI0038FD247A